MLVLMFFGILVSGVLGGAIGYGIVDTSCTETPTVADQLLESLPDYEAASRSCDVALLAGAAGGTLVAGVGAGVVAGLVLRAQSEWRAHPPSGSSRVDRGFDPVNPAGSGGTPPHR
jgi:hypothetical protein